MTYQMVAIIATPGPSIIPDRVLQAMQRPAPDIYKGETIDMTKEINLKYQVLPRQWVRQ